MFSPSFEWNAVGRPVSASAPAAAWDSNPEGESEPVANMRPPGVQTIQGVVWSSGGSPGFVQIANRVPL